MDASLHSPLLVEQQRVFYGSIYLNELKSGEADPD